MGTTPQQQLSNLQNDQLTDEMPLCALHFIPTCTSCNASYIGQTKMERKEKNKGFLQTIKSFIGLSTSQTG